MLKKGGILFYVNYSSTMIDLICGLRCRIYPDKAGYSKEAMFVDSHMRNSKNQRDFG